MFSPSRASVNWLGAQLSGEQQALWTVARANRALPSRYRYVSGLSAGTLAALHTALSKYGEFAPIRISGSTAATRPDAVTSPGSTGPS